VSGFSRPPAGQGDEHGEPLKIVYREPRISAKGEPLADADLDAALDALSEPGRLRDAEHLVTRVAPQLQRVLASALQEGGWFDDAHRSEVLKAATTPDPDERIAALRTLLAEETRIGMMVGVAVGWQLARELSQGPLPPDSDRDQQGD
jgi:hypothetical protein